MKEGRGEMLHSFQKLTPLYIYISQRGVSVRRIDPRRKDVKYVLLILCNQS